ncbi:uncharacterized protein LOC115626497 [Scaptodrosophila lebanonensis]|uniref:Uncharacterized protein LOC115626497 n=1 Tax=Drosophila lebanonensis TaxID=7225 RepID=A0A6J2TRK7_DROLE|nr:uncharacterized protein LOC115626497 [Scaptodrosophila lebanonensis]
MKLSNKNFHKICKDAGIDVTTLSWRQQIEILTVLLSWIPLLMGAYHMGVYCVDGIVSVLFGVKEIVILTIELFF